MGDGRDTGSTPTAQSGASRSGGQSVGIIITFITAVAVFTGGRAVVAQLCQSTSGGGAAADTIAETLPSAATPPNAPAPPAPSPPAAAAPTEPPVAPPEPAKPTAAAVAAAAAAEGREEDRRVAERDRNTEKEIAREAWRKNVPDVSGEPTRATILIPIKGSIEGATYHVGTKPRSVIVNLPKAESLITMRFYSIKRDGFRTLWIKKDESDGTTLRLMLGDAYAPQVEIRDDYVRITVRKPNAPG